MSDADKTMPPALSSDAELPAASLSSRPSWRAYLEGVDLARESERAIRVSSGVSELYPRPARVPVIGNE